ncbi:zinc finger, CCHC-type containing protein [Tanacetum coccineum]
MVNGGYRSQQWRLVVKIVLLRGDGDEHCDGEIIRRGLDGGLGSLLSFSQKFVFSNECLYIIVRCAQEYSVYTKKKDDDVLIIGVYVDDLIVTGSCHKSIQDFKRDMKAKFEMSDLGLLSSHDLGLPEIK